MHYRVKGMLVKSENAAKPMTDAARPLIDWLTQRPYTHNVLDYGCGKLRYAHYLAARSAFLGLTDSSVQLNRIQRIDGHMTDVRQYANQHWPTCHVYDLAEFWRGIPCSYEFILCANVLSAIPCPRIRAKSLRSLHAALAPSGTLLVTNQHANSYFTEAREKPHAFSHLDGWVLQSRNGVAYYGILDQKATIRLLTRFGFVVVDTWTNGQSNYVLAKRSTT